MELNEYQRRRLEKAQSMRARGIDPYPARTRRTHSVAEAWATVACPDEPMQLYGAIQGTEDGYDLVSGRERLQLVGLPTSFTPPEGQLAVGGRLALSPQGRAALRVESWGPTLDEAVFPPAVPAEARDRCLAATPPVVLTGRLTGGVRSMGKALFVDLEDGSVLPGHGGLLNPHIQLFLSQSVLGAEAFAAFADFDPGDIVEAAGRLFFTRAGQLSLEVSAIRMLTKAINPPPEKFHGLTDVEKRLRERYADLIANEEVRHRFRVRALVLRAVRCFLDERGFLEVETPVLQPIYGGAAAEPFVTHHNQLDQDLYLRISFELYLKRLIVGMYQRVYEIGHDFRNEGVDRTHLPEFTQLELYQAYTDYQGIMQLYEEMVAFVAEQILGSTRLSYQGQEIEFAPPWARLPLLEAIHRYSGIDVEQYPDFDSLLAIIRAGGGDVGDRTTWGKLVDWLLSTYVEPNLVQPTFLTDYPLELSPLAKRRPDRPDLVERFEGFAAGMELCNAFSELNDPMDQLERFAAQGRAMEAGDAEAHPMDMDFVNALMYGMPPTGGLGTGIDRLAILFTNQTTIREVTLFPHMRT